MLTPLRLVVFVPIVVLIGIPLSRHLQLPLLDAADAVADPPKTSTLPPDKRMVYANGITEGIERSAPLHFEIGGRLKTIDVEVGEAVQQGQVLAQLQADDWEIGLAKVEASLRQAQAQYELLRAGASEEAIVTSRAVARAAYEDMDGAKKQYERVMKVKVDGVITGEELDRRKATYLKSRANYATALARLREMKADARSEELRAAEAKVALAQAAVMDAKYRLSKTQLRAPFDGIVLERWGEPGQLAGPDSQRPIVTMVDATEKRVRAFVEELDALHVQTAQRVYVTTDGQPDVRAEGEVIRCAPAMVEKTKFSNKPGERSDTRVREVTIRLLPGHASDRLLIGQPVDVLIEVPTKDGPTLLGARENGNSK